MIPERRINIILLNMNSCSDEGALSEVITFVIPDLDEGDTIISKFIDEINEDRSHIILDFIGSLNYQIFKDNDDIIKLLEEIDTINFQDKHNFFLEKKESIKRICLFLIQNHENLMRIDKHILVM